MNKKWVVLNRIANILGVSCCIVVIVLCFIEVIYEEPYSLVGNLCFILNLVSYFIVRIIANKYETEYQISNCRGIGD